MKILIAVDSSETSVAAADAAHRLFGEHADYLVINVASDVPILWGVDALQYGTVYPIAMPGAGVIGALPLTVTGAGAEDAASRRIEESEDLAESVAAQAGVPHPQVLADSGDAADAINAAAREHDVDVIVIGSHDRGWVERLFTKSVSSTVLREAELPVLVVR